MPLLNAEVGVEPQDKLEWLGRICDGLIRLKSKSLTEGVANDDNNQCELSLEDAKKISDSLQVKLQIVQAVYRKAYLQK